MSRFVQVLVLVAFVAGALGQDTSNDASTVSPQDIYDLSEDDFKLWLSGRQPKAWEGGASNTSPSATTTTPRPTTPASVFRTTTPATTPSTPSFLTTSTTIRPTAPFSDGKSWFEEEDTATAGPAVLGEQFKPAGENFEQWLERQMNRVQEVTFVPQTTLTGDQLAGAGLVTRLTTIRNRIPATTFRSVPVTDFAPVTTPTPPIPAPAYLPAAPQGSIASTASSGPLDLQQWLRDQLQTSQRLTDNLLAQWGASGAIVRADGHHYTPNAVSYQTSALIHGLQGVSHSGHVRNEPVPVTVQRRPTPNVPRRVFYPAGSFFYSHPQVPQYGSFVGHQTPLVIKYH
ncbi:uncharacterized protein LOC128716366 [Anopheles marshallii]|uniref:uncharacterized protein LOC128716366 n=1 Tax=Anopheles marshallii TaxID=1521116 RepID=UPI00237B1A17|nr:uncharacterized protein LOC128716366 [Anopheles marshallii]